MAELQSAAPVNKIRIISTTLLPTPAASAFPHAGHAASSLPLIAPSSGSAAANGRRHGIQFTMKMPIIRLTAPGIKSSPLLLSTATQPQQPASAAAAPHSAVAAVNGRKNGLVNGHHAAAPAAEPIRIAAPAAPLPTQPPPLPPAAAPRRSPSPQPAAARPSDEETPQRKLDRRDGTADTDHSSHSHSHGHHDSERQSGHKKRRSSSRSRSRSGERRGHQHERPPPPPPPPSRPPPAAPPSLTQPAIRFLSPPTVLEPPPLMLQPPMQPHFAPPAPYPPPPADYYMQREERERVERRSRHQSRRSLSPSSRSSRSESSERERHRERRLRRRQGDEDWREHDREDSLRRSRHSSSEHKRSRDDGSADERHRRRHHHDDAHEREHRHRRGDRDGAREREQDVVCFDIDTQLLIRIDRGDSALVAWMDADAVVRHWLDPHVRPHMRVASLRRNGMVYAPLQHVVPPFVYEQQHRYTDCHPVRIRAAGEKEDEGGVNLLLTPDHMVWAAPSQQQQDEEGCHVEEEGPAVAAPYQLVRADRLHINPLTATAGRLQWTGWRMRTAAPVDNADYSLELRAQCCAQCEQAALFCLAGDDMDAALTLAGYHLAASDASSSAWLQLSQRCQLVQTACERLDSIRACCCGQRHCPSPRSSTRQLSSTSSPPSSPLSSAEAERMNDEDHDAEWRSSSDSSGSLPISQQLRTWLQECAQPDSKSKQAALPSWCWLLSSRQSLLLLQAMAHAASCLDSELRSCDGARHPCSSLAASSQQRADELQILAAHSGLGSAVSILSDGPQLRYRLSLQQTTGSTDSEVCVQHHHIRVDRSPSVRNRRFWCVTTAAASSVVLVRRRVDDLDADRSPRLSDRNVRWLTAFVGNCAPDREREQDRDRDRERERNRDWEKERGRERNWERAKEKECEQQAETKHQPEEAKDGNGRGSRKSDVSAAETERKDRKGETKDRKDGRSGEDSEAKAEMKETAATPTDTGGSAFLRSIKAAAAAQHSLLQKEERKEGSAAASTSARVSGSAAAASSSSASSAPSAAPSSTSTAAAAVGSAPAPAAGGPSGSSGFTSSYPAAMALSGARISTSSTGFKSLHLAPAPFPPFHPGPPLPFPPYIMPGPGAPHLPPPFPPPYPPPPHHYGPPVPADFSGFKPIYPAPGYLSFHAPPPPPPAPAPPTSAPPLSASVAPPSPALLPSTPASHLSTVAVSSSSSASPAAATASSSPTPSTPLPASPPPSSPALGNSSLAAPSSAISTSPSLPISRLTLSTLGFTPLSWTSAQLLTPSPFSSFTLRCPAFSKADEATKQMLTMEWAVSQELLALKGDRTRECEAMRVERWLAALDRERCERELERLKRRMEEVMAD